MCLIKLGQLKASAWTISLHQKTLHISYLLSTTCAHACLFVIATTQSGAAQTKEDLKTFLKILQSSRRTFHKSTACGGVHSAATIYLMLLFWDSQSCNNFKCSFIHFTLSFDIHLVITCVKHDPGTHVIYAPEFASKLGCDKVVPELCWL